MKIQPVVDSLDVVDASLRDVYTEVDGKYELDFTKYDQHVQRPLLKSRNELLDEKKKLKPILERAEKFKDFADEDFDDYQQWREKKASGDDKSKDTDHAAKTREEVKKATDKLEAAWKAKHDEATNQVNKLNSQYKTSIKRAELMRLGVAAGVHEDRLKRFVDSWIDRFDVPSLEDSKLIFLDDQNETSHLSPDQAIKQHIFEAEPFWFKANDKGGSGAPNGNTSGNRKRTMSREAWEKLSPAESTKFFADGGTLA